MEIIKTKYKVIKDKDFIGKRYDTYTIEKTLIYDNGEIETRYRTFIPFRDGDINKINLNTLDFPNPITQKEWEQLSEEYRKAWTNGTMTKKLCKELENLRLKEAVL